MREALDEAQRRRPWAAVPVAVIVKALQDRAPYLAALLAYYGFVSLFPLLLLLSSVLGFVLDGNPELRDEILGSALQAFPGLRQTLRENVSALHGSGWGLTIGVIGTLYGGLGIMQAAQAVMNQIYGVPRSRQPNVLRSRLRSLAMLAVLALAVAGSATVTITVAHVDWLSEYLPGAARVLAVVVTFCLNILVFSVAYQFLTATSLRLRNVLTGGFISAAIWYLLQLQAGPFIARRVTDAGAVYGVFALVLAALGWIYIQALAFVLAAQINVVISHRLWPRTMPGAPGGRPPTEADNRAREMCAAGCHHHEERDDDPPMRPSALHRR